MPPRPGDFVTSRQAADGTYAFQTVPPSTPRYTYMAWVDRVVDGDTFIAAVDLGFGTETWTLRFRLAGIDTSELSTLAGRNARDFTTAALEQVDFVILRTHRTDDYGRYLVDVRYQPGEPDPDAVHRNGRYLNTSSSTSTSPAARPASPAVSLGVATGSAAAGPLCGNGELPRGFGRGWPSSDVVPTPGGGINSGCHGGLGLFPACLAGSPARPATPASTRW